MTKVTMTTEVPETSESPERTPTRPKSSQASTQSILRWLAYSLGLPKEIYSNIFKKNMGYGWASATYEKGTFVGSSKLNKAWRVVDTPLGILFEEVPVEYVWPRMSEAKKATENDESTLP